MTVGGEPLNIHRVPEQWTVESSCARFPHADYSHTPHAVHCTLAAPFRCSLDSPLSFCFVPRTRSCSTHLEHVALQNARLLASGLSPDFFTGISVLDARRRMVKH